jgi:L-malate glycosyltransferase
MLLKHGTNPKAYGIPSIGETIPTTLVRDEAIKGDNVPRPRATICHVLHSLCVGGAEVLVARLARRLGDSYRFLFVCLDELGSLGRDLRAEGFPVHVLERRAGLDWDLPRRMANFWRAFDVDLVHAHQYTPFFYSLVARWWYRRLPVLFTEHGRHFPDYPRKKRILANRLLLNRRDRIVGVGQAVRMALIENEGLPADRVGVIYNGVDLSAYASGTNQRDAVRKELGIGDQDLMIVQVARLDYLKDHATALRTLQHVLSRRPEARLVLVGEGPERASIEGLIHEHRLTPFVRVLGLRRDVPRLLGAADVFLLSSISEGIPLTIIEAMAAGVPVVSTDVGGVAEILEHGLLAPAGDAAGLADAIVRLASDPRLRTRMVAVGRARAFQLSEQQMHKQYVTLYQEMTRV